jgi:hypothetical protein
MTKSWLFDITTYLPHPKLSHKENWSFGDLVLANCLQQRFAIASQYFLVLVQNTTLNGDKNQKKPIVTPGGAECGLQIMIYYRLYKNSRSHEISCCAFNLYK